MSTQNTMALALRSRWIVTLAVLLLVLGLSITIVFGFSQKSAGLRCNCDYIQPLLIEKAHTYIEDPIWSPDGDRIAYSKVEIDQHGRMGATSEVFVIESNGKNIQQLTTDKFDDTHPTWSPDSSSLVVASYNDTVKPMLNYLRRIDLRTGKVSNFYACKDYCVFPTWSPNGKSIAFQMRRKSGSDFRWDIWLLNVETLETQKLTSLNDASQGLAWSADSTKIYFVENGYITSLWIDDMAIKVRLTLASNGSLTYPTWAFQSSTLAFVQRTGSTLKPQWAIYISEDNGETVMPLIEQPVGEEIRSPSFAPDDTKIVFVYGDGQLYIASLENR